MITGIEVKSGRRKIGKGIDAFRKRFPAARVVVVGDEAIPVEEFLMNDPLPIVFGG